MSETAGVEMLDKPRAECGIVAVVSPEFNAGGIACGAVSVLDNRGHEMTGVVTDMGDTMPVTKGIGTGVELFPDGGYAYNIAYPSRRALAQARYSTQGSQDLNGAQPHELSRMIANKKVLVSHVENGNLTNTHALAAELGLTEAEYVTDNGLMTYAFMDSIAVMVQEKPEAAIDVRELVRRTVPKFEGAFTSALMIEDEIVVYTDHHGFKPAVIGELSNGGTIIASEVTALEAVEATFVREMNPGEMVIIHDDGSYEAEQWAEPRPKRCLLELLYVMKPETVNGTLTSFGGLGIREARTNAGRALGDIVQLDVDFGFGVPNSGVPVGEGFTDASNIPYEQDALIANKHRRSFIEPTQEKREIVVNGKLEANPQKLEGKRVVGGEDSVIRGTTAKANTAMMIDAGVAEYHLVVGSPMVLYTCDLGVDLGDPNELLAARAAKILDIDISQGFDSLSSEQVAQMGAEMRDYIGVSSLTFLSPEQTRKQVLGNKAGEFCMQCMTGEYPDLTSVPVEIKSKTGTTEQSSVIVR